jgi:hypothetical protein
MFFRLEFLPWVDKTLRASRNAIVRAGAATFALPALILCRMRAWLPGRYAMRPKPTIEQLTGQIINTSGFYSALTPVPEPLPVGTPAAVATAMQATPMPSRFVNTPQWMMWEAHQRQHDLAARFAMQSTMPKFNPAMFTTTN